MGLSVFDASAVVVVRVDQGIEQNCSVSGREAPEMKSRIFSPLS